MTETLRKVKPGDPLRIPAKTFNAFIDAAVDHQHRQRSSQTTAPPRVAPATDSSSAANVILIRNDSGEDRRQFHVLGIDAPVILPTDNRDEFKRRVALRCVAGNPDQHAGRFVVLAEPVRAGAIGRAWAGGVCPARVVVDSEDLAYAELQHDDPTALKAVSSGPVAILWKQPGTGTSPKWAIIRFGGGPDAGLIPVKLWRDGGTTDGSKTEPCSRACPGRSSL